MNFSGTRFWDADCSGAYFSWSNLSRADLSRAKAIHANFASADLSECILRSANLQHADFTKTNLRDVIINGADIRGADLRFAKGIEDWNYILRSTKWNEKTRWPPEVYVGLKTDEENTTISYEQYEWAPYVKINEQSKIEIVGDTPRNDISREERRQLTSLVSTLAQQLRVRLTQSNAVGHALVAEFQHLITEVEDACINEYGENVIVIQGLVSSCYSQLPDDIGEADPALSKSLKVFFDTVRRLNLSFEQFRNYENRFVSEELHRIAGKLDVERLVDVAGGELQASVTDQSSLDDLLVVSDAVSRNKERTDEGTDRLKVLLAGTIRNASVASAVHLTLLGWRAEDFIEAEKGRFSDDPTGKLAQYVTISAPVVTLLRSLL